MVGEHTCHSIKNNDVMSKVARFMNATVNEFLKATLK